MPARKDLETILIIGSGPIIIGQACEFDYSGVQAVRALEEDGHRVVLLNPKPRDDDDNTRNRSKCLCRTLAARVC